MAANNMIYWEKIVPAFTLLILVMGPRLMVEPHDIYLQDDKIQTNSDQNTKQELQNTKWTQCATLNVYKNM